MDPPQKADIYSLPVLMTERNNLPDQPGYALHHFVTTIVDYNAF